MYSYFSYIYSTGAYNIYMWRSAVAHRAELKEYQCFSFSKVTNLSFVIDDLCETIRKLYSGYMKGKHTVHTYMSNKAPPPTSLSFRLRMLNAAVSHTKDHCAKQCWTILLCAYSTTTQGTISQLLMQTISTSLSFKLHGPSNQLPEMMQSVIKR